MIVEKSNSRSLSIIEKVGSALIITCTAVVLAVTPVHAMDSATSDTRANAFNIVRWGHYNISFNGNGSTSGAMAPISDVLVDENRQLPENLYVRTGYSFSGWNTAANGSGTSFGDQGTVTRLSEKDGDTITLYAQWSANDYTVRFNGNGNTSGNMAEESFVYDTAKALTSNGFDKTGYSFAGWATTADGDVVYANKETVKNLTAAKGEVVNLYAKWEPIKYSVKYVANTSGVSGTMDIQELTYDTSAVLSNNKFVRKGYQLTGWATSASGEKTYENMQSVINLADNEDASITLYGVWTPVTDVTGLNIDSLSHTHVWSWKYNKTEHWQECDVCGAKGASAQHSIKTTGSTLCGSYTVDVCSVCGYEGEKTLHPHIMHVYTEDEKKSTNIATYYHWIGYCTRCGETTLPYGVTALETTGQIVNKPPILYSANSTASTSYCVDSSGRAITCVNRGTCTVCGYDYGSDPYISHHSVLCRTENGVKTYYCQFCGQDIYKLYSSWAKQSASDPRHWEIGGIFELLTGEWNDKGNLDPWGSQVAAGAATLSKVQISPLDSSLYNNASVNTVGKTSGLWQVSYTADIAKDYQGSQTIRLNADNVIKNVNGNSSEYAKSYALSTTIIPDNDAPTIKSVIGSDNGTIDKYSTSATVTVTVADSGSDYVTVQLYDASGNVITQPATVTSSNGTFVHTFDLSKSELEIQEQSIVICATDRYGHQTKKTFDNVLQYIDTKAPALTNPINNGNTWSRTVEYTAVASDGGSGSIQIGVNKLSDMTLGAKTESGYTKTYMFVGDKYDDDNYIVFLADGAQNQSQTTINIGYIDNTAPHINTVIVGGYTVTVDADDINVSLGKTGSGVAKYGYMSTSETTIHWGDSAEISLPAAGTYYVFAQDAVGNISEPQQVVVSE